MVGVKYTAEQRNCLVMGYEKYKGTRTCMPNIIEEFQMKFPGVNVPHRNTIRRVHEKQMTHYTTHNLNSKTSPGDSYSGRPRSARTPENIQEEKGILDRDSTKDMDDPLTSPVNTARKNLMGLAKSSWSRIVKELKYHPYKMVRTQLLKPQDFNRRLLMCNNLVRLRDRELLNFCF